MEIKLAMATPQDKFGFTTVGKPEETTYEFSLGLPVKLCND
jgi:hypothetical protein